MEIVTQNTIWKLTGCVMNYHWGGKHFLPELICLANDEEKPFAELWFGQHPACPSISAGGSTLPELIGSSPETFFTPEERKHWKDELPFLCKILDVQDMLSIQIHPDKQQAADGFQRENEANVSMFAAHRSFRDANHKPEMMYALSEFYLLQDFRKEDEIVADLEKIPSLKPIAEQINTDGLESFYRAYMQLEQKEINRLLRTYVRELELKEVPEDLLSPEYWIKKALVQFCTPHKVDRGILSFYLMNLVFLHPGEVVFQESGVPHAYLHGQNVEIMANSDNVIRGGLTSKHIDVQAMSSLVCFDNSSEHHLKGIQKDDFLTYFPSPADEFALSVIELEPGIEYSLKTKYISLFFSTCNCILIQSERQEVRVGGGEAALVRSGENVVLRSRKKAKVFWVAQGKTNAK